MNTNLLIFFAIPLAVIVISIALQRLLKCPSLVAGVIFVIFLIVAVVLNDINVLILAIVYALLAYVSALLYCIFCKVLADNDVLQSCTSCCGGNNDDTAGESEGCCNRSPVTATIGVDSINNAREVRYIAGPTSDTVTTGVSNNSFYIQPQNNMNRRGYAYGRCGRRR